MPETMIRKNIYVSRRQKLTLKRLAKQRGISEAAVIRQALEREAALSVPVVHDSHQALEKIFSYVESLRKRSEFMQGKPYKFNRDELYAERESRLAKSKGK